MFVWVRVKGVPRNMLRIVHELRHPAPESQPAPSPALATAIPAIPAAAETAASASEPAASTAPIASAPAIPASAEPSSAASDPAFSAAGSPAAPSVRRFSRECSHHARRPRHVESNHRVHDVVRTARCKSAQQHRDQRRFAHRGHTVLGSHVHVLPRERSRQPERLARRIVVHASIVWV